MAKIGLILTLGTHDIQLDFDRDSHEYPDLIERTSAAKRGKYYPLTSARYGGEYLLDNYTTYKALLKYPVVEKAIDKVLEKHENIDSLLLVYTDQKNDKFMGSDTISFKELLVKNILPAKYNSRIENILCFHFDLEELTKLDKTFPYLFEAVRKKNTAFRVFNEENAEKEKVYKNIYLCNQTGIDAINAALLRTMVLEHGSRLKVLSVVEQDTGESTCEVLAVTDHYLQLFEIQKAKALIARYDYAALAAMNFLPPIIKDVASYAACRLNFNFTGAENALQNYTNGPQFIFDIQQKIEGFRDENDTNNTNKYHELYWNAYIKYTQGAYVDFLVRLCCIFDAKNYNTERQGQSAAMIAIIPKLTEPLKNLRKNRDNCIGAHGFSPVSVDMIVGAIAPQYGNMQLFFKDIQLILDIKPDPYKAINDWMSKQLDEITFVTD